MSAAIKIRCPICNQEFPAYDQRGFRNAGFTAHHNRCLERRQQQNEPQQRDHHTSRASRFAWAVRRRLLPARPRPTSSTNVVIEGQNRSSPQSPLSGSSNSSSSSSSSSPPNQADIAPMTPIVPSQAPHPKHNFHPRQRHTWNHWTPRRRSRRSALDVDTTLATVAPSIILPSTADSRIVRSCRSLPVMVTATDTPTFPLLTAITTMDSTTALIIPQTTSPHLSNHTPVNSPILSGNGSPFSFTSMLTTLPLETASLLPSTTISACSSNSNSANDRNSVDVSYQRPTQTSMDSISTDWMIGQYPFSTDDTSRYQQLQQQQRQQQQQQQLDQHQHNYHAPYGSVSTTTIPQQPAIDSTYYRQDTHFIPDSTTSTSSTYTLPKPLRSPENLNGDDDEPVNYCGYCQPHDGQHDPSCSLMQFIMMDIIGGNDDPSSSH
ncbi:hypothetical protein BCR42DRAFT_196559 [Absidia repens]|uniref:Uncharacterized protein n=1 Tax=Absidia repens TaxID=90262 RepID=A0A1X2ISX2_9FUNG|nr:hypothetical protein BCR42DRAFT_196559 [Absidia repens]